MKLPPFGDLVRLARREVEADPFIRELWHRVSTAKTPDQYELATAIDVIGYQRALAFALLEAAENGSLQVVSGDHDLRLGREQMLSGAALVYLKMSTAVPFLWLRDARLIAATSPFEVPDGLTLDESFFSAREMWWAFAAPIKGEGEDGTVMEGMLIFLDGERLRVFGVGSEALNRERNGVTLTVIADSKLSEIPQHLTGGEISYMGATLAMQAFLSSKYIPKTKSAVPRAFQKAAARADVKRGADVTFIDLRSIADEATDPNIDAGSRGYRHRWIVRGHLRAQWYPSDHVHRIIYVPAHQKGPEGAPLLDHVFRVRR